MQGDGETNEKNKTKKYIFKQIAQIYIFFVLFFCLILHRLAFIKDQFAVSYFSTSLIVLIQVYNWEIRHRSLICCRGLADILCILI